MNAAINFLKRVDCWVSRMVRAVCVFCLAAIFVLFLANVFVRFVPVYNFTQTDDWIQLLLVWMIFLGAQELVRTKNHFVVDVITERIAGTTAGNMMRVLVCLIEFATYLIIFWYGIEWVMRARAYMQSIPWLQIRWVYCAIPFSVFFMMCYSLRDLVQAFAVIVLREDP